ncbi:hypothetical protein LZ32DRAFT_679395 [Colletotrichum eremochloae]|nr:hypothetical protein LZ32DRAFT_679395 [Colletotrichum eremochloae]
MNPIEVLGVPRPNTAKVILPCEELGVPYETEAIPFPTSKVPNTLLSARTGGCRLSRSRILTPCSGNQGPSSGI